MALSDSEREKTKKRPNRAISADSNFRWSDKQKLEAVNSYLALGNLAMTSRILAIPEVTLRVWKASEWWKNAVEEAKLADKIVLSNRMKSLVDAAQTIVAQRLEQGDPFVNPRTGNVEFKPISLKDAHRVAVDNIDRKAAVEKITVDEAPVEESNTNKLEALAEKFAAMAMKSIEKKQNKERTVDAETVEIIDAVHEEREAGLQAGIREIPQSTGANQEPDGENHRTSAG